MAIPPGGDSSGAGNTPNSGLTIITATPTNGQTVSGTADGLNQLVSLEHTGTIATMTLAFPSPATRGQIFEIGTTGAVTALTMNAAGATIMNPQTQLAIGDFLSYRCVKANTWMRR